MLERQLEDGGIDEPPLLALDLEAEDVVRVVVHREPLRARRRVVRVRLHGMTELSLEATAELGQRRVLQLERLEDDRRAAVELVGDPLDASRRRERLRRPRNVLRVVGEDDLLVFLDDSESRPAQLPSATRRSTSAIDSRSRKRPSSSRGTRRGLRSQYSPRKRAPRRARCSARARWSYERRCRRSQRRSRRCLRRSNPSSLSSLCRPHRRRPRPPLVLRRSGSRRRSAWCARPSNLPQWVAANPGGYKVRW